MHRKTFLAGIIMLVLLGICSSFLSAEEYRFQNMEWGMSLNRIVENLVYDNFYCYGTNIAVLNRYVFERQADVVYQCTPKTAKLYRVRIRWAFQPDCEHIIKAHLDKIFNIMGQEYGTPDYFDPIKNVAKWLDEETGTYISVEPEDNYFAIKLIYADLYLEKQAQAEKFSQHD